MNRVKEGIIFLNLKDSDIIKDIYYNIEINKKYQDELSEYKHNLEKHLNRFNVPKKLNKDELESLKKETEEKIKELENLQLNKNEQTVSYLDCVIEDYKIKVDNINKILNNHNSFGEKLDVERARNYPIDSLLEFNHNKTLCIWHDEKTPSLCLKKEWNKATCFGGCGTKDSIDVAMKLYNLDFKEAVRFLTNKNG